MIEVDEIAVPLPDFAEGQRFGPVTVDTTWEEPVDLRDEVPVTFTPDVCRFLGVRWYPAVYHTRGVFTVTGNRISLTPTSPITIERAAWWRRIGYRLFARRTRTRNVTSGHHSRAER